MALAIARFTCASSLFNKLINKQHLNNYCLTLNSLYVMSKNKFLIKQDLLVELQKTHLRQCDLQAPTSLFIIKSQAVIFKDQKGWFVVGAVFFLQ